MASAQRAQPRSAEPSGRLPMRQVAEQPITDAPRRGYQRWASAQGAPQIVRFRALRLPRSRRPGPSPCGQAPKLSGVADRALLLALDSTDPPWDHDGRYFRDALL